MPYKIHFLFSKRTDQLPKTIIGDDGKADFTHLNLIENIVAGQPIARVEEVSETITTGDLSYEDILVNLEALEDYLGENVEINPQNPKEIIAQINGYVTFEMNKINIFPVFETVGDVDFSTGNLTFIGSLIVKGNVSSSYSVQGKEVIVYGSVNSAEVRSASRVLIKGDVIGKKSSVIAEGDVSCKFIENATVRAKGNLLVSVSALHSYLTAGNSIVIKDPGILTGAVTTCKHKLFAKRIGANWSNPTEIIIGDDPFLIERLNNAQKMVQILQHREAELEKLLSPTTETANNQLSDEDKVLINNELNATRLSCKRFKLFEEILLKKIEKERKENTTAEVYVFDQILPGTKITFFDTTFFVKSSMEQVVFYFEDGEIKTRKCQQSFDTLLKM
ncbi:MAG: DUF342 domain-containing protein [Nitrospinae bacterium]|nr:DUF342 domain-containing protein [Nitrospinota bacterium]